MIRFESKLTVVNGWTIMRIPRNASDKLPSRGMVMAEGTINGYPFQTPLEPDGKGSHWFEIQKNIQKQAKLTSNQIITIELKPMNDWPEPELPSDLEQALNSNPEANTTWESATPRARWDWIRWIRSTKNPETRNRRIQIELSKLVNGEKRPCCFNRNICTVPEVSQRGILIDQK